MGYLDTIKLQRRILWLAAIAVVLTGLSTAALIIIPLATTLQRQAADSILATLELRAYALTEHAETLHNMANQVASRTAIRQALERYSLGGMSHDDLEAFTTPRLADALDSNDHMKGITRLDANGRIISQTGMPVPGNIRTQSIGKGATITGPFQYKGALYLSITTPVLSSTDNRLLGIDILLFEAAQIAPALWISRNATGTATSYLSSTQDSSWYTVFEGELIRAEPPPATTDNQIYSVATAGDNASWVIVKRTVERTPWRILVAIPEEHLYGDVRNAIIRAVTVTFAITLAGILALLLVLRPLVQSTIRTHFDQTAEIEALNKLRAEMEEERRRLDASNQDLEQFAYAASHDLQQPLRMITGFLDLLRRRASNHLTTEELEFVDFAAGGAKRLREMINGLLEYSRVGRLEDTIRPVDLQQTVELAMLNLRPRMDESMAIVCLGDLPVIRSEPNQMLRLFQNLIDNAVKYSAPERPPRIIIESAASSSEWAISISDNGRGIDPALAGRAFRLFQRMNTDEHLEGTGLGLAMCQKIVTRHGGTITLDTSQPVGLRVVITLPRDTEAARPQKKQIWPGMQGNKPQITQAAP